MSTSLSKVSLYESGKLLKALVKQIGGCNNPQKLVFFLLRFWAARKLLPFLRMTGTKLQVATKGEFSHSKELRFPVVQIKCLRSSPPW